MDPIELCGVAQLTFGADLANSMCVICWAGCLVGADEGQDRTRFWELMCQRAQEILDRRGSSSSSPPGLGERNPLPEETPYTHFTWKTEDRLRVVTSLGEVVGRKGVVRCEKEGGSWWYSVPIGVRELWQGTTGNCGPLNHCLNEPRCVYKVARGSSTTLTSKDLSEIQLFPPTDLIALTLDKEMTQFRMATVSGGEHDGSTVLVPITEG